MMRRFSSVSLVVVAALAFAGAHGAAAAVSSGHRGDTPGSVGALGLASPVHDGVFRSRATGTPLRASTWGGTFTTSRGNQIRMYGSSWYRVNNQWLQDWANWLDTYLPHGAEFSQLTIYFVPESSAYFDDLESLCGPGAGGCYSPSNQLIVAPGNNLSDGTQMASVLTHEYGHHLAHNRVNPPWDAGTWGPKRWASYMNICARVSAGTAFPGDESSHYTLNPGEGWAEAYRETVWSSYNWVNGWWPDAPWNVVDQSFYPDSGARSTVRVDALSPWVSGQSRTYAGRLTKQRRTATIVVDTPYDGDVSVALFSPFGARLTLIDGDSAAIIGTATASFAYTTCGQRSLRIRVAGPVGKRYRLTVTTP
jgi:hypothetical protein